MQWPPPPASAKRAIPHQVSLFQRSVDVGSVVSMLGVRPVKSDAIDIVVWWKEARAWVKSWPRAARASMCGVDPLAP